MELRSDPVTLDRNTHIQALVSMMVACVFVRGSSGGRGGEIKKGGGEGRWGQVEKGGRKGRAMEHNERPTHVMKERRLCEAASLHSASIPFHRSC